jgi:hypothetical protein
VLKETGKDALGSAVGWELITGPIGFLRLVLNLT